MHSLPIAAIKVGERFRRDLGDLDALARSIEANGLLHAIVVTEDKQLVAGVRRLEAVKKLGWGTVPVRVVHVENLLLAEHDENEVRKDFTTSERVAIADAIREHVGERRGRPAKGAKEEICPNGDELESGERTDEVAARKAGFGSKSEYRRAKAVTSNGAPELVEAMDKGEVSVSAAEALTALPRVEQKKVVEQGPEAVTAKAKEIRESQAKGREAEKVRQAQHPHSDQVYRWLRMVSSGLEIIQVEQGGIAALLAEPDRWDWQAVREKILPVLEDLEECLSAFRKEIDRHAREQRKA